MRIDDSTTERERKRNRDCQANHREDWAVSVRHANYSTFNGGRRTPSDYSEVVCTRCRRRWRTKAAYVDGLPNLGTWS